MARGITEEEVQVCLANNHRAYSVGKDGGVYTMNLPRGMLKVRVKEGSAALVVDALVTS
jgi:hypothetical protein